MIRIACYIQDYYFEIIKKYFVAKDYYLEKFNPASYDDIYFIEINSLNDLDKIHQINKYPETLIYIIGPKDFHLLNECLTLGVHLYFENDDLEDYKETLKSRPYSIQYIRNPTQELIDIAIQVSPSVIKYIEHPTQEQIDLYINQLK